MTLLSSKKRSLDWERLHKEKFEELKEKGIIYKACTQRGCDGTMQAYLWGVFDEDGNPEKSVATYFCRRCNYQDWSAIPEEFQPIDYVEEKPTARARLRNKIKRA